MVRLVSLRTLIAAASALVFVSGCDFSAGPVHLQILTGGVRYDDFVIQPMQEYARFHSSKMVLMDALIVASEEQLTLPKFSVGWTFQVLGVSVHHPEFLSTWTGESKSPNREMTLRPLQPQRWVDYLKEHGEVGLHVVENHLQVMLLSYVPVFEAGESRKRLRRYLPGLRELVQRASWLSRPSSRWPTEADARAEVQETLQAISELIR
jgi:hypothetical protein